MAQEIRADSKPSGSGSGSGKEKPMRKIVAAAATGISLACATASWGGPDPLETAPARPTWIACFFLDEANRALSRMIDVKDRSAQDRWNAEVQAASTKIDRTLASMGGEDAKIAADFKTVWEQFKATQQTEIIPAVYAGRSDEAEKIATGVQAERLTQMRKIMSCQTT
jgi:hypothetical protein